MTIKDAELEQLKIDLQAKTDKISEIEAKFKVEKDTLITEKESDLENAKQELTEQINALKTQMEQKDTQIAEMVKSSESLLKEEDMSKSCYHLFNEDLKKRIGFLSKLLDWESFGGEVASNERAPQREKPSIILDPN